MRDTKRIKAFCDRLAEVWEKECPDWRFNQLVENVWRFAGVSIPFYIEDDKMLDYIEQFFYGEHPTNN